MEPSSGTVDHSSAGGDRFDRFGSQNEEWIFRLQNLREEEEESLKESKTDSNVSNDLIVRDQATKAHSAATRTILHSARLANLQSASFAYREQDCGGNVILETDRLFLHVQREFDTEKDHHQSILDSILPVPTDESSQKQKLETNASQSFFTDDNVCNSIAVDAFFEDYPECGRSAQEITGYFSESGTDSDSDEEKKHQVESPRRKRRTQSSQEIASMTADLVEAASEPLETQQNEGQVPAQEPKAQTPAFQDNQQETRSHQSKNRKAKPLSANNNHGNINSNSSTSIKNPHSMSAPSFPRGPDSTAIDLSSSVTNNDSINNSYNSKNNADRQNTIESNRAISRDGNRQSSFTPTINQRDDEWNNPNNTQQRQINANPYHRNKPQTTNQGYNRNNFHGREDSTSNDAWRDHRNQTNPFQTAREVALAEENHPHRDPYRQRGEARSRPQHSYNNPYGHDFQGQNNNPSDNYQDDDNAPAPTGGGPFIPESLKRKFQRPKRGLGSLSQGGASKATNNRTGLRPSNNNPNNGGNINQRPSSYGGQTDKRKSNDGNGEEEEELPEELQHLDKELVKKIQNEIMESGDKVTFDDIAGLADAKKTVREVVCWPMKRPDLFTGLRRAPNGLLLYGPPGTGKTLIGKAIAHESGATFFSISSSSLTSKWIGEGEKLVKTLFAVAAYNEPAVIFLDEIDSLLTQRKATENEASRRIKTEFLVQLDGTGTSGQGRVLIIGATNRPQELDEAARRRFTKRLYIPLPVEADRKVLLGVLLKTNKHVLTEADIDILAKDTDGFSGADLKSLCTDAAMGPIRQLGAKAMDIDVNDVPPISYKHFKKSLKGTRPSVAPSDLKQYIEWDESYGTTRHDEEEEDD